MNTTAAMTGKTTRIFLADGAPTGALVAEVGNWKGKVIVVPRAQLGDLDKRLELRSAGVAREPLHRR